MHQCNCTSSLQGCSDCSKYLKGHYIESIHGPQQLQCEVPIYWQCNRLLLCKATSHMTSYFYPWVICFSAKLQTFCVQLSGMPILMYTKEASVTPATIRAAICYYAWAQTRWPVSNGCMSLSLLPPLDTASATCSPLGHAQSPHGCNTWSHMHRGLGGVEWETQRETQRGERWQEWETPEGREEECERSQ